MKQKNSSWIFLIIVLLVYLVVWVINKEPIATSLSFFLSTLKSIIPVLFFVFSLMAVTNYFTYKQDMTKKLKDYTGLRIWILAIGTGLICTGSILMWYPLLRDLKNRGVKDRFIAAFLYSTAVKPALVPLLIVYFGLKYTIILIIVMIIASIAQGLIVEKLSEV